MNSDATIAAEVALEVATAAELATAASSAASPAGPKDLREAIVKMTGSGYTPVRSGFVQKHAGKNRASTLGKLVRGRKRRELVLYLLVLTVWDDAKRAPWPADVWLRALHVDTKPNLTWSRSTLSETWTSLVTLKLVRRTRERRRSRIAPRREHGKGPYARPDGRLVDDHYFALPGDFWTEEWFDRLSLPAIAVLLILLKETNKSTEIPLTYKDTALWYGISESSAKKGYLELIDEGLATTRDEWEPNPFSQTGLTVKRFYSLTGDFSTAARAAARAEARKERRRRLRKTAKPTSKRVAAAVAAGGPT